MYKALMWSLAALLLMSVVTWIDIGRERTKGPVFIESNGPVSDDQVQQKLLYDGWTDVRLTRNGRFVHVVGSKGGQASWLTVDAQTGRLRGEEERDDDGRGDGSSGRYREFEGSADE
jgi:hypothetical protein